MAEEAASPSPEQSLEETPAADEAFSTDADAPIETTTEEDPLAQAERLLAGEADTSTQAPAEEAFGEPLPPVDSGRVEALEAKVAELEVELEGYRRTESSKDDELERLRGEISRRDREALDLRSQLNDKDRTIVELRDAESKLAGDASKTKDEKTRVAIALKAMTTKVETLTALAKKHGADVAKAQADARVGAALRMKVADLEKQLATTKKTTDEAGAKATKAVADLEMLNAELESTRADVESAKAEAAAARTEAETITAERDTAHAESLRNAEARDAAQSEANSVRVEFDASKGEADGLRADLAETRASAEKALASAADLEEKLTESSQQATLAGDRVKLARERLLALMQELE